MTTRDIGNARQLRGLRLAALASCCALALLAGGCGQKGPLYLPEPQPQAVPPAGTVTDPASEAPPRRKPAAATDAAH